MARNINIKRMLAGILLGFFSRILYQQVENAASSASKEEFKENCLCHIDYLCPICEPMKAHTTDTSLSIAFKPKGMYEVTRWQFLDEEHIFDIINEEPKIELKGVHKEDVKAAIETGMDYINVNQMMGQHWSLKRLQNGYMRSDARQGTDFMMDMVVHPTSRNYKNIPASVVNERLFRVVLRHPLYQTESLKLESIYKHETKKIKIIIPAHLTSAHLEMIIEDFDKIQVANVELLLVLFHENFATAKDLIKTIKQKISKSSTHTRIVEVEDPFSYHKGLARGISETEEEDLIVALQDDVLITNELLNHCKSICIEEKRVFFPVPYAQFNSEIVQRGMPPGKPKRMNKKDHNKFLGQWAHILHNNFCAYRRDLSHMLYAANKNLAKVDGHWIYNEYLKQEYEVVMAVEPNLYQLNYDEKCLPKKQFIQKYAQCIKYKALHLASKPALGILYIKETLENT